MPDPFGKAAQAMYRDIGRGWTANQRDFARPGSAPEGTQFGMDPHMSLVWKMLYTAMLKKKKLPKRNPTPNPSQSFGIRDPHGRLPTGAAGAEGPLLDEMPRRY